MKEEIAEKEIIKNGKPWNVVATFNSYNEADSYRNNKIDVWLKQEVKGMQAKVKRRADDTFVVKTRLHPDFEPKVEKKKEKKRGKGKNRNPSKRNTDEGKSEVVSPSV
jgi:glutamine amidotransferase-like uncharacterized protein